MKLNEVKYQLLKCLQSGGNHNYYTVQDYLIAQGVEDEIWEYKLTALLQELKTEGLIEYTQTKDLIVQIQIIQSPKVEAILKHNSWQEYEDSIAKKAQKQNQIEEIDANIKRYTLANQKLLPFTSITAVLLSIGNAIWVIMDKYNLKFISIYYYYLIFIILIIVSIICYKYFFLKKIE